MLTINLLPPEFRVKEKKVIKVPYMPLLIAGGAFFGLITMLLYADYWMVQSKLKKINHDWQFLQPQSVRLKDLEEEVEKKLKPENIFLNRFVTADKPLTFILNWASEFMPETTWLSEFKLERMGEGGRVFLKGLTLPSKEKNSIQFIEVYMHELKQKMPDAQLSLTTSRQKIKDTEVTQFIATFEWGNTGLVKA